MIRSHSPAFRLLPALALPLAVLFAVVAAPAASAQPATGTISVGLTNGTEGGGPLEGTEVRLLAVTQTGEQTVATGKVDPSGAASFEDVDPSPDITYCVEAIYAGVAYRSDAATFATAETAKTIRLSVYETTTTDEMITLRSHSTVVARQGDGLGFLEMMTFVNGGDRTYIGDSDTDGSLSTLRFALPSGASDVQYLDGLDEKALALTDAGFADTRPVRPGETSVAYSYILPTSLPFQLSRTLDYPTAETLLLLPEGMRAQGDGLRAGETVETAVGTYQSYLQESFPGGTTISWRLGSEGSRNLQTTFRVLAGVLSGLAMAGAVLYVWLRPRLRPSATAWGLAPTLPGDAYPDLAPPDERGERDQAVRGDQREERSRRNQRSDRLPQQDRD